jgi:hypothetical protein
VPKEMARKWRDIRKQRPPEGEARIQACVEQESKRLGQSQGAYKDTVWPSCSTPHRAYAPNGVVESC